MAKPDRLTSFDLSRTRRWPSLLAPIGILLLFSILVSIMLAFGVPSITFFPKYDMYASYLINHRDEGLGERRKKWIEVVSWEPRVFLYHNFLSKEECNHLIDLAKPHIKRSLVVDKKSSSITSSRRRTSSGMFLARGHDKVVQAIEQRIADFTFIPIENGEDMHILHYGVGEEWQTHHDYISNESLIKLEGRRMATLFMYLSDVEEGGETVFPRAKGNNSFLPKQIELSQCGQRGIAVKPKMGNALLFWSLYPNATFDGSALHAGCPVIRGNEWSSTKWLHTDEYIL